MKTSDVILAAKAVIADPKGWYNGLCSRGGGSLDLHCAWTAFDIAEGDFTEVEQGHAERLLARSMNVGEPKGIPYFNDSHSHDEVMAAFDRAYNIARAQEQEHEAATALETVFG